jgi:hypothetical protein
MCTICLIVLTSPVHSDNNNVTIRVKEKFVFTVILKDDCFMESIRFNRADSELDYNSFFLTLLRYYSFGIFIIVFYYFLLQKIKPLSSQWKVLE